MIIYRGRRLIGDKLTARTWLTSVSNDKQTDDRTGTHSLTGNDLADGKEIRGIENGEDRVMNGGGDKGPRSADQTLLYCWGEGRRAHVEAAGNWRLEDGQKGDGEKEEGV